MDYSQYAFPEFERFIRSPLFGIIMFYIIGFSHGRLSKKTKKEG